MKRSLAIFILILAAAGLLSAQSVSNIRVEQDPELRYYKITFDLSGKADEQYQIRVTPYKDGKEPTRLSFLSGQGIGNPCKPGKDLKVFWNPDLEGFETDGWQFRIEPSDFVPYDYPPVPIGSIKPVYPDFARRANVQGTVVLEVDVFKDGSVGAIRVVRSVQPGPGGLDEAAINAVRAVSFQPGKRSGNPVDTTVIIPVDFKFN